MNVKNILKFPKKRIRSKQLNSKQFCEDFLQRKITKNWFSIRNEIELKMSLGPLSFPNTLSVTHFLQLKIVSLRENL